VPGYARLQRSTSARNSEHRPTSLPVHEGYDCLYVLDGRLRLLLGKEDLTIPGVGRPVSTRTPRWFGPVAGAVDHRDFRAPTANSCTFIPELDRSTSDPCTFEDLPTSCVADHWTVALPALEGGGTRERSRPHARTVDERRPH